MLSISQVNIADYKNTSVAIFFWILTNSNRIFQYFIVFHFQKKILSTFSFFVVVLISARPAGSVAKGLYLKNATMLPNHAKTDATKNSYKDATILTPLQIFFCITFIILPQVS